MYEALVGKRARLAKPFVWYVGYAAYAAAVWSAAAYVDALAPSVARAIFVSGAACVLASCLAFALCVFWRAYRSRPFEEYLIVASCRSGVAAVCALVALTLCPEDLRRACAWRILIAYWATFPLHVWLTLPPKGFSVETGQESNGEPTP